MPDYGLTDLQFYMHYPMCGHCTTAWDLVYQRLRSSASPGHYLQLCPVGGCDPEIWDFLDDNTGWPLGWKLAPPHGTPIWSMLPDPPMPEDEAYHRRKDLEDARPNAPWRRTADKLRKAFEKREARRKGVRDEDLEFDTDADEEPESSTWVPDDELDWG